MRYDEPVILGLETQWKKFLKEKYRIFWIVKGHINIDEETVIACYDSYFKRVWYNEEADDKGFEEEWAKRK